MFELFVLENRPENLACSLNLIIEFILKLALWLSLGTAPDLDQKAIYKFQFPEAA